MPSLYINDTTFFGFAKLAYSACLWGFCALTHIAHASFLYGTDEPLYQIEYIPENDLLMKLKESWFKHVILFQRQLKTNTRKFKMPAAPSCFQSIPAR